MRFETPEPGPTGWTPWIHPKQVRPGYKMSCCDCGLVHLLQFRIHKGKVLFRARRHARSTAMVRRHAGITLRHE